MYHAVITNSRLAKLGLAAAAAALALTTLALAGPAPAKASVTCTWGGTPAAPTGTFTIHPGLRNEPTPVPLKFEAVGNLGGESPVCHGRVRYVGHLGAGSSCANASFEGAVKGLPGVASFRGEGSLDVPAVLFDRAGNVVGFDNAEIATESNLVNSLQCQTPGGFTGPAGFSAVIGLF